MPASSLPVRPGVLTVALQPTVERSPTIPGEPGIRGFGGVLEPRYIVGAKPIDQ